MRETDFIVVKENMLSMLKYSKSEFNKYKSTRNIIYLQQSGEKLFNALENYIQFINKIESFSFAGIKSIIKERSLRILLYDARNLHRFFYKGENEMNIEDAEILYMNVKERLESRIRNL